MAKAKIPHLRLILFILFSLVAFILRIIPFEWTKKGDILVHYDWSKTIYTEGFKDIYFYPKWTYSPPTQPPLMMFAFWTSRHIYENRYLLSELHNQIRLPPASFILWFDKYGEFLLLRLWAILADFACAFLVYFVVKKYLKNDKIAFIAYLLTIFNPLSILETTLWGQNDILSIFFAYLAFLNFSPLLFLVSILFKPTTLVIAPFFAIYYIRNFKINKNNLIKLFVSALLCCGLIYLSFRPFLNSGNIGEIYKIITQRIISSSKGISRASNSAFNIYSLLFDLDKTPGAQKVLGISLDTYSLLFYILLNVSAAKLFLSSKKSSPSLLLFLIFYISQGSFLLMTGMLERYFFPAYLASIILIFLRPKYFAWPLIMQNFFWFINMFYAYFQRESDPIKHLFENNHNFLIRIISLLSILNFYFIYRRFRKYSATKNQY